MTLLVAKDVSLSRGRVEILHPTSVQLGPTGSVAIIGPNGAGKSSLMRLLAGQEPPTHGQVALDDRGVHAMPAKARAQRLGYLPQHFQPYWDLTAQQLIELGAERAAVSAPEQIEAVIGQFELDGLRHRRWSTLSGGEQSRVVLAMVLVVDPPVLLADEPAAALDIQHRLTLVGNLAERGRTRLSVVVMHDLDLAFRFFDRIILIADGAIVADGPAASLVNDPRLDQVFGVTFERLKSKGGVFPHGVATT